MLRNTIYFNVKPFLPRGWRTAIRRWIAVRQRNRFKDIWPIMPGSERPPEGWPGWPDGKKFAFVLTHDVEGQRGLEHVKQLAELEMELGFRSSFNFIPEGSYQVHEQLRAWMVRRGFEVGVHDLKHDGRLFRSLPKFKERAIRINRYLRDWNAAGFRSGFMLHNLDWLHELEIEYDASTFDTDPFEPQPEGRHTIFPFWLPAPADQRSEVPPRRVNSDQKAEDEGSAIRNSAFEIHHSAGRAGGYVELPYTLPQDSTLFLLLSEKTADIWMQKLDWIAANGGMALLDTHPDYMNFRETGGKRGEYPVRLYAELLEYVRSKYEGEYWHVLPREVAEYASQTALTDGGRAIEKSSSPATIPSPSETVASLSCASNTNDSAKGSRLRGRHAAVLLYSYFPADPRPRRATEALVSEGASIEVVCLQKDGSEPRHETIGGVEVFRIPIKRRRGNKVQYLTQYSAFILRSFVHLSWRSLLRKYDFVHIHNMPDVLVFSALVPKAMGAKIVLDLHDPMPELMQTIFGLQESSFGVRFLKHLEKLSIQFADLVVTVNVACSRIFSSRSCGADKITVVMNSPDDKIFQFRAPNFNGSNGSDPAAPFSILYHGSLVPRNGFDLAVDALEIAQRRIPGARLIVCGERNAFFEEVMASVHKRGLQESVHYLGVKNRRQIVEAINSCDLGVVPNHQNSFTQINTPTRIFEYLSLGKPVIAPRTLGIEDYFGKGDLLFFDAGDSVDLARQIEFAYFNRSELMRIVERGQQVYLANSWSRQKASLIHSISELF